MSGFFPTDANDQDEIGPNTNGSFFKYIEAENKWIIVLNASAEPEFSLNNWKVFYSNGSADIIELALGDDGDVLTSTGTGTAPVFAPGAGGEETLAETLAFGNETDGDNIIIDEGGDLIVYSDDKITEVARIDGATGNITTIGTVDGVSISAHDGGIIEDYHDLSTLLFSDIANMAKYTGAEAHAFVEANALTMENNIAMGSHKITGLTNGSAASDAMAFGQKYTLEQHNNTYHSTNYHSETDGTGVATVHSDITSIGSGAIITTGERNALHAAVTEVYNLRALDDRDYKPNTSATWRFIKGYFTTLGGMTGSADTNYQDLLILNTYSDGSGGDMNALTFDKSEKLIRHWLATQTDGTWGTPKTLAYVEDTYTQTQVNTIIDRFDEQSSTFPVSPAEGDFHYDEDDDSLFRYNAEALAWIEVGAAGGSGGDFINIGSYKGQLQGHLVPLVGCVWGSNGIQMSDVNDSVVCTFDISANMDAGEDIVLVFVYANTWDSSSYIKLYVGFQRTNGTEAHAWNYINGTNYEMTTSATDYAYKALGWTIPNANFEAGDTMTVYFYNQNGVNFRAHSMYLRYVEAPE